DSERLAQLRQRTIALRRLQQVEIGPVGGARGRRGEPLAADLREQVHVTLRLGHTLRAARVVVHDPLRESDPGLDGQAEVADALSEVFQRTAARLVAFYLVDPGLDSLVSGLRRDVYDLVERQLLTADGAGIEAVAERLAGLAGLCGNGCGRCHGGSYAHTGCHDPGGPDQQLAARQSTLHALSALRETRSKRIDNGPNRPRKPRTPFL